MLRSTRTIASLIRTLTFGSVIAVAGTAATGSLIGCKDEGPVAPFVKQLGEPARKAQAIKRLEQFFDDAMTKTKDDYNSPEVKGLLDQIAVPLTETYVNDFDTLEARTRSGLLKLISSFRDERTIPALKKALDEYAAKPKERDYEDLRWAARGSAELRKMDKGAELSGPMLNAFLKLKLTSQVGQTTFRDLSTAMLAKPDKAWVGPLISTLSTDIEKPKQGEVDLQKSINDQTGWQVTAARLLGEIGDESAIEPLLMVVLDPAKGGVATTAIVALVKFGKPAMERTFKLLKGEDEKLKTHSLAKTQKFTEAKEPPKDEPYVQLAIIILGTMGRQEALPTMVEVLNSQKGSIRALFAQEMAKIPATDESKTQFKKVFEETSLDSRMPPSGASALLLLNEATGRFFDPSLVPWILERAAKQRGSDEDLKTFQANVTVTAMKLAKADQMAEVKAAVEKYGTKLEKDTFALIEPLVKECGDRADCYLERVEKSENQDEKNQFVGMKSAYMVGILGDEKARDGLIERLGKIRNAAVRSVTASAIDYLTPKGSVEVADKLQAIIDANAASPDRRRAEGDAPLQEVAYRIRARAASN